ncbi:MAG: DUF2075 domain-containing protein [Burkholderiales bacterium]|nr:DUF2075 domain-containing protein [Burkholderiales bacterium]
MIIYQATKDQFIRHATRDDIEEVVGRHFRSATGHGVSPSEVRAWKESLHEMSKVLQDEEIPGDVGIGIEYQVPRTSKRIDFIIAGENEDARARVIIVELKQWSTTRRSDKDAIVWARRGGPTGETEGLHPSYQAWTYAALLEDFNAAVQDNAIALRPCAYLHNHPRDGEIDHPHYKEHLERAPLFLMKERAKLQAFIRQHVRHGDRKGALYAIENGRIRPSKMLADSVVGLLQGNPEFVLIDEQKLVQESVLAADARSPSRKQVLIVQGGPGTGKSVLAINLLGALIGRGRNVRYVSKNAAPRAVYAAKLAGTFKKTRISNLFGGSGSFVDVAQDTYDVLVVDEAHRLNEKSGLYRNFGENQVAELIRAARCTVFFVDDHQRVTFHDIGHSDALRKHALAAGAEVTELELSSQFRCNGSDGYLAWIDQTLGIRTTANQKLEGVDYDFRVFENPADMHALVELRNGGNRARVVAGYCWEWPSRKDPSAWDIEMPGFGYRRRWNLNKDGSLWIVTPGSVDEVGCIHTCQGLELDYVGVIIGPDLVYRDGRVQVDVTRRASSDQSVKGLKKLARTDPKRASAFAELIVRNTYRTLMTRGMKGCYVYCADVALAEHLRTSVGPVMGVDASRADVDRIDPLDGVPLRRLPGKSAGGEARAVPVIDLRTVQQRFADRSELEAAAAGWVELPSWVSLLPGMFVARRPGIRVQEERGGGEWCLFRAYYHDTGFTPAVHARTGPEGFVESIGEILTVLPVV